MEILVFKYSARPVRHIGVLDPIEVYITDTFFMHPYAAPYPLPPSIDQEGYVVVRAACAAGRGKE